MNLNCLCNKCQSKNGKDCPISQAQLARFIKNEERNERARTRRNERARTRRDNLQVNDLTNSLSDYASELQTKTRKDAFSAGRIRTTFESSESVVEVTENFSVLNSVNLARVKLSSVFFSKQLNVFTDEFQMLMQITELSGLLIKGGALRDSLLGFPITDLDIFFSVDTFSSDITTMGVFLATDYLPNKYGDKFVSAEGNSSYIEQKVLNIGKLTLGNMVFDLSIGKSKNIRNFDFTCNQGVVRSGGHNSVIFEHLEGIFETERTKQITLGEEPSGSDIKLLERSKELSVKFGWKIPEVYTRIEDFQSDVEDVDGVIYGYRTWSVENGLLISHGSTTWYPYKALEANSNLCIRGGALEHKSPCVNLIATNDKSLYEVAPSCGIYAKKDVFKPTQNIETFELVMGSVKMWGRMVEYETGWKSQFAYPNILIISRFASRRYGNMVMDVAEKYGIDFEVSEGF